VPDRITALLNPIVGDGDLRRIPRRSTNAEVARLEESLAAERRSLLSHDAGTRLAFDPENLHKLRVAGRRIRAYLRVARGLLDETWSAEVDAPLRRLGRVSGPARDLDVLIERLRAEAAELDQFDATAAAELIGAFEDERDDLQDELVEVLDDSAHRRLLETLGLPVEAATELTRRSLGELAERELRRLLATVRKLGNTPPDDELHAMRLKVKRVRYAVELGGLPGGKRKARVVRAATELQDLLGEHQDAAVAEERLRRAAELIGDLRVSFAAGRLAERQSARREAIQAQLPAAWRRLRKLCL
jgi:CHAD domain-containing protein